MIIQLNLNALYLGPMQRKSADKHTDKRDKNSIVTKDWSVTVKKKHGAPEC